MSNFTSPDGKYAWSYQTQIKNVQPNGIELWNVTDYSRVTSEFQRKLFAPYDLKGLRGNRYYGRLNNIIILNNVPQGTADLAIYIGDIQHTSSETA